jgi:dihydropyrimidinase
MQYELVIKGGQVVSADGTVKADVAIEGEKIVAVAEELAGKKEIDASGKLVLPGALDVHTHFQLPFCGTVSADGFTSGSRAAALGGVTTFIDFAIQSKPATLMETVAARRAEADPKVCVDYGLHAGITDWNDERIQEIPAVIEAGLPTFKMFMIYKGQGWQSNDGDLYAALRETAKYGGMVGVHAENNDLIEMLQSEADRDGLTGCYTHTITRPEITETEAIARAIMLAEASGGTLYIFHMSTGAAADILRDARAKGINVHAETGPHYLLLDDELFKREDGHHFATCPPIRKPADQAKLWERITDSTLEVLATDTCTFTREQKAMWNGDYKAIPFGMPGIEALLPLTYTHGVGAGRFSVNHMVAMLSENPARLFGLEGRKGKVAVGHDADIVLFDPELKVTISAETHASQCDYEPFEGVECTGWPVTTLLRGKIIVWDREFVGKAGDGTFLKRKPPVTPR